jgi:MoaA/NifB/PqqE/SkfB family radical SAM enzyme
MVKAVVTKNSPFYVQFFVSKFCDQNCQMCNIVKANADLSPFSIERMDKIADNLVKIGVGVVLLTGGEPFLRSDLDLVVKSLTERNLDVRMQSAGLMVLKEGLVKKCIKAGVRDINISLDSLDENLSDHINGLKGSWRRAIKSIAMVSRLFPKDNSICALGCVLSPYNVDEIESILKFATKIGWWLSLVPVHINSTEEAMNFRGKDKSFIFDKDGVNKVDKLMKKLKVMKRQGYLLFDSDDYLDSVNYFVKTSKTNWRCKGKCDSPNLYFAILPDGSFAPCADHRLAEKIFLDDDNFPKIYNSRKFRDKVEEITSECQGCDYGSYPEMSLSVRSSKTFWERLLLQFKVSKTSKRKLTEKSILKLVDEIKNEHQTYYESLKF